MSARPPRARARLRLLPLLGLAAVFAAPAGAAPGPVTVEVLTLAGAPATGRLTRLGPTGATLATEAGTKTIAIDDIRVLVFPHARTLSVTGPRWRATLAAGDAVLGRRVGIEDRGETLLLEVAAVGILPLGLDLLRALEFQPEDAGPCHDLLATSDPVEGSDVMYDEEEDRLVGTLVTLGDDVITFEDRREQQRRLAWSSLRVLRLANPAPPLEPEPHAEVELTDGSRFEVPTRLLQTVPPEAPERLRFESRSLPGRQLEVALERVAAVRFSGGRFVYATELPFESEVETPAFDHPDVMVARNLEAAWQVRVDRSRYFAGPGGSCPLRIAGTTYRHGFAVHATTRMTFDLGGAFERFTAGFGIDDVVLDATKDGSLGNVHGIVTGDGKKLWDSRDEVPDGVVGGRPALAVACDVAGVQQLVLEVTWGADESTTLDRAAWVDPVLVRAAPE